MDSYKNRPNKHNYEDEERRGRFIVFFPFFSAIVILLCVFYGLMAASEVAVVMGNNTVAFYLTPFRVDAAVSYIQMNRGKDINTNLIELFHRKDPEVTYELAQRAVQKRATNDALVWFKRAVDLDSHNTDHRKAYVTFLVDNHLFAELREELLARGGFALNENWSSRLYKIGLEFVQKKTPRGALPFWRAAAVTSRSWSHVQIEYASLLRTLGQSDDAHDVLVKCEKDVYAGSHCREALYYFDINEPTPPGYYRDETLSIH